MSYLDEKSARELIVQPVEDFTNIFARTAIDTIIHLTRCQPYLVQLTCYEVVELLNRDIRENRRDASTAKATARDVETVIPTVLERGGQYFGELWKSLTESDLLAAALALSQSPPASSPRGNSHSARQSRIAKTGAQRDFGEKRVWLPLPSAFSPELC